MFQLGLYLYNRLLYWASWAFITWFISFWWFFEASTGWRFGKRPTQEMSTTMAFATLLRRLMKAEGPENHREGYDVVPWFPGSSRYPPELKWGKGAVLIIEWFLALLKGGFFPWKNIEVSWVLGQDRECHPPNLTWVIFRNDSNPDLVNHMVSLSIDLVSPWFRSSDSVFLFEKGERPFQDTRRKEWTSPSLVSCPGRNSRRSHPLQRFFNVHVCWW